MNQYSRRSFIKTTAGLSAALACSGFSTHAATAPVNLYAHLWVYASRYPPNWDCTEILDTVFSDIKEAGYAGLEIMESILRHEGSVERFKTLIDKYRLPLVGTSYNGDMWDKEQQQKLLEDFENIIQKLNAAGGKMVGLTVGDAERRKTEEELDTQADTLHKIIKLCNKYHIQPNLHNHSYEVKDGMHDFKGTIQRVPELKLGPDLNWLVRGGVNPVWFVKTYGERMVFMHIRDQAADGRWTEAVGEGVIDFAGVAKALKAINYSGNAAVELAFDAPPKRAVKEDWKISRQYVKQVFGW